MTLRLIVDRRQQGGKSTVNRNRFIGRVRGYAQDALDKRIREGNIEDINEGMDVHVPKHDLSQPEFHHGQGGVRDFVLPGNKKFIRGDQLPRPEGGGGGGKNAGTGESQDDFVFRLSPEEVLKVFFDDMQLPNMKDTAKCNVKSTERMRAGLSSDGVSLDLLRSVMKKKMRKIGTRGRLAKELEDLEEKLRRELEERDSQQGALGDADEEDQDVDGPTIDELIARISELRKKVTRGTRFDPSDLRYKHFESRPKQIAQAVMFCLMDVSGSMDEVRKDLAKRFFMLLYWFLTSKYEHVELVFIRHTDDAEEVDQETFFHDTKSGGTVVLSAMEKVKEIITARFSPHDWNIYVAQASDGDVFGPDALKTTTFIHTMLLPLVRYMAYVEVAVAGRSDLMKAYTAASFPEEYFGMRSIQGVDEVFPALHGLFKKEVV